LLRFISPNPQIDTGYFTHANKPKCYLFPRHNYAAEGEPCEAASLASGSMRAFELSGLFLEEFVDLLLADELRPDDDLSQFVENTLGCCPSYGCAPVIRARAAIERGLRR
jgi:hypothetical protein